MKEALSYQQLYPSDHAKPSDKLDSLLRAPESTCLHTSCGRCADKAAGDVARRQPSRLSILRTHWNSLLVLSQYGFLSNQLSGLIVLSYLLY